MNRRHLLGPAAMAACLWLPACYDDIKVVQGTVVKVDSAGYSLTVRNERDPKIPSAYKLASRANAKRGDVVRIAFREHGRQRLVVRLMNVTRARSQVEK